MARSVFWIARVRCGDTLEAATAGLANREVSKKVMPENTELNEVFVSLSSAVKRSQPLIGFMCNQLMNSSRVRRMKPVQARLCRLTVFVRTNKLRLCNS